MKSFLHKAKDHILSGSSAGSMTRIELPAPPPPPENESAEPNLNPKEDLAPLTKSGGKTSPLFFSGHPPPLLLSLTGMCTVHKVTRHSLCIRHKETRYNAFIAACTPPLCPCRPWCCDCLRQRHVGRQALAWVWDLPGMVRPRAAPSFPSSCFFLSPLDYCFFSPLDCRFFLSLRRKAPVSQQRSTVQQQCWMEGSVLGGAGARDSRPRSPLVPHREQNRLRSALVPDRRQWTDGSVSTERAPGPSGAPVVTEDRWPCGLSLGRFANWIGRIPQDQVDELCDLLFDKEKGLGLNVVRYNIGGGADPAKSATWHDTTQRHKFVPGFLPAEGAPYNWAADPHQRNVLLGAKARGVNLFGAISYAPPAWMTVSGDVAGVPLRCPSPTCAKMEKMPESARREHPAVGVSQVCLLRRGPAAGARARVRLFCWRA